MSFGFGVGDFLAVIKLANDIRKDFADAPEQFQQITAEVRNLAIVLGDVDVSLAAHDVSEDQKKNLSEIRESCRSVLEDSHNELSKYVSLESKERCLYEHAKRAWKRVKWEPDDIRDLRGRITANIVALNSFTGANIRDTVFRLEARQIRQENREILDWLTPLDTTAQQADFISQRQAGTGQWLLDSTEYNNWKATKGGILFCHGIPGAGKTICSSIVVDNLQNTLIEAGIATCYFYFNFKRQIEQSLENVLLSLLKQLCQAAASLPDAVQVLYDRCRHKPSRPSREEIVQTLHAVFGLFPRVLIVVDALDECQTSNGCQKTLVSHLIELQRTTHANIMATSRPVPHIVEKFKGFSSVEVRASEEDIHRYIESNLTNLPGFVSRDKKLQNEVKDGITKAVDGIFLLAKLHLDSLEAKTTTRKLREALKTLVTGNGAYDEAYKNTMNRIGGQLKEHKELAMKTLMWIVHAKRPLSTTELQHALGVESGDVELFEDNLPDLADMVSVCCGLVTIDGESSIIRLIHYTTQEFFERHRGQYFPDADAQITDTCVTYLAFDEFENRPYPTYEDLDLRPEIFPLYKYSSQFWGKHASFATGSESGSESIWRFLNRPSHVQVCGYSLTMLDSREGKLGYLWAGDGIYDMTRLHLAAYFGLVEITNSILNDPLDTNIRDSRRRTPLWYAARYDHQDVVRQLLDRTCHLDMEDEHHETPLIVAAENGHEDVVRLLLDRGAQIDYSNRLGETPLSRAAARGHKAVMDLLLSKGAQIDHKNEDGETSLWRAAADGQEDIVKLLLDEGAQIDYPGMDRTTPLSIAAASGHEPVVSLLLDRGARIDPTSIWVKARPLMEAAKNGHEAIVCLLLDRGARVDQTDESGITPLWRAAAKGHEDVVRLLLDRGAQIDYAHKDGRTSLWLAAAGGHEAVVRLLLDKGAQTEPTDIHNETPLWRAAAGGHEAVVRLLLDKGAQIDPTDTREKTRPSIVAAENGHEAVVRLLLDKGAQIDYSNRYGETLLSTAAGRDLRQLTEILIKLGAKINCRNPVDGSTPLIQAAERGHSHMLALLLAANADHQIMDSYGRSALMHAFIFDRSEAIDVLLAQDGLDPNAKDHWGSTIISFAARFGNLALFRKIAALPNVNILAQDCFGRTSLWWAQKQRHNNIIREILGHHQSTNFDVTDAHAPTISGPVNFFLKHRQCRVCLASEQNIWYSCDEGHDIYFDICQECHGLGARCFIKSHQLLFNDGKLASAEEWTSEEEDKSTKASE